MLMRAFLFAALCAAGPAAALDIEEIQRAGNLSVCANSKAMPVSGKGEPGGYQLEIAREIAKDIGVRLHIEWVWADYQVRYTDCDMILGVARDPKPGGHLRYLQAISDVDIGLVFAGPPRSITPQELRSRVIAVPSASLAHFKLIDLGADPRVAYKSEVSILTAIADGTLDGGVVSSVALNWFRHQNPDQELFSVSTDILGVTSQYPMTIGLRKSDALGEADFQEVLAQMRDDGRLEAILDRYGQVLSTSFDDPYATMPDAVSEVQSNTVQRRVVEELERRVEERRKKLQGIAGE